MPSHEPSSPPALPATLRKALRRVDGCGRTPDAGTRAAILALARARLEEVPAGHARRSAGRSTRRVRPVPVWAWAAAALVAVLAWTVRPHGTPIPMDLDGNGRVDVLDAFVLRRAIDSHATRPRWDFDHDGEVAASDVDLVLRAAVRIEEVSS